MKPIYEQYISNVRFIQLRIQFIPQSKNKAEINISTISVSLTKCVKVKLFYENFLFPEIGIIRVVDVLDYERIENYTVSVRATDTVTGHYVDVPVEIQILDVNDHRPKFHHQFFNPKISEAAAPGTTVMKMLTKDKDTGENAGVSYSIGAIDSDELSQFMIHSGSGLISLRNVLDREVQSEHKFLVIATDTGNPPLSATALVVVTGNHILKHKDSNYISYQ